MSAIASKIAAAIAADTNLQTVGINAASSGSDIRIRSSSPDVTSYAQSTSGSATETISIGMSDNVVQNAKLSVIGAGYESQLNDVLSITVFDAGLGGGSETVSYTVPANGTALSTIASALASSINADTALGVSATASSQVVSLSSTSVNLTTYSASVSPSTASGTEAISFATNVVGNAAATISGSASTGDFVDITVRSPKLSGGHEAVLYSVPASSTTSSIAAGLSSAINADTNLQAIGLGASSTGAVISLTSSPTYSASKSSGATENIALGTTSNGQVTATISGTVTAGDTITIQSTGGGLSSSVNSTYTVLSGDSTATIATGLASLINTTSTLQAVGISAGSSSSTVSVKYNPVNAPVYIGSVTSGATEKIALSINNNSNQFVLIGGAKTTGDVVSLTAFDPELPGGKSSASYTVLSSDSLATITAGLASAINSNTDFPAAGIAATSSSNLLTVQSNSTNVTHYGQSTSGGATETVTIGLNPNGVQTASLGGTKTTGDVLTILVTDAGLSGGQENVSYTVQSSDTTASIASGIASAINADTSLAAIGVTATAVASVVNIKSTSTNATTYNQSKSSGATETIMLATGTSVVGDSFNNLNQLIGRSAVGAIHFQSTTHS